MHVGFVTCAQLPEPDHDEPLLLAECARTGIDAELFAWDGEERDLARYGVLVLRSCWNYHLHLPHFLAWLRRASAQTRILNPPAVVEWNADKTYLTDPARGLPPCVPTVFVPPGSGLGQQEWDRFVIKPSVSASSYLTKSFDRSQQAEAEQFLLEVHRHGTAMVQPYLPSVNTAGERSVCCFDGKASHVVVKKPRFHDQDESVSAGVPPTAFEHGLVAKIFDSWLEKPLYARVDLLQDEGGAWLLGELELIEPSLFLLQAPGSVESFVRAIRARL